MPLTPPGRSAIQPTLLIDEAGQYSSKDKTMRKDRQH
jgi:hypothetical protein